MSAWPMVALGEVLSQDSVTERIDDPGRETFLTIRLYGNGLTARSIGAGKTPKPFVGYRTRAGQFVYSRIDARNGAYGVVPGELDGAVCSKDFPKFDVLDEVAHIGYLLRLVQAQEFYRKVQDLSFGATNRQRVKEEEFLRLQIPLPPLPEQRRIAGILDHVDALRAKRREALAKLEELAQSIFVDMFGSVELVSLGPHLEFVTSGGRGWSKYYAETGELFIRSLDVQMNQIETNDAAYVDAPDNAEARRTRTRSGDVLLTITGSRIGRAAPVEDELSGSYVSQHVAILRPNGESIDPGFLSAFLCLPSGGQAQIARVQYGQTKPGLNFEQIRGFQIPGVSPQRQLLYMNYVKKIEVLRDRQRSGLVELGALFESLQSRAFSGVL